MTPRDQVTREVFWNIPPLGRVTFYALAAATLAVFGYGVFLNLRRVLKGRETSISWDEIRSNLFKTTTEILSNRTVARRHRLAGLMHAGIMWGFIALFIGTVIISIEFDVFQEILGRPHGFWTGSFFLGYELTLDTMGTVFLLSLAVALARRYVFRTPQLSWKPIDFFLPASLLLIGLTGFIVEGLRLATTGSQLAYSPYWSPTGFLFSRLWQGMAASAARRVHGYLWWTHGVLALGWIAALPFTPKVTHILGAGLNMLFREQGSRRKMVAVDVEAAFENNQQLGFGTIADLTKKDLLDLVSCTECGRCEMNCPANISGKTLSPRNIITKLRDLSVRETPFFKKSSDAASIMGDIVSGEEIWACTTCMACVEACPVYIDPLGKILELRRNEVLIQDRYPESFGGVFTGITKRGNPWNQHPSSRLDWAKGLSVRTMAEVKEAGESVDYLLWIGCSAAFDPRNQRIARSLVKLLNHARVSFAVLGEEESCTGDPARRMGHEYLYQIQARTNVETLKSYVFQRILTLCPHCFQGIGKEYRDFGGSFPVVHHTELIHELVESGKLHLDAPVEGIVTYHDSCYLGRYNGIFDPPREVLKSIPGLTVVEMKRNRENSMCCGAGGGMMWIEEESGRRVNQKRVEQVQEALDTEALVRGTSRFVASACPFCMTMIEDGLASRKTDVQDKDIVELVTMAMGLDQ